MKNRHLSPAVLELGVHEVDRFRQVNRDIGARQARPAPKIPPARKEISLVACCERGYSFCVQCGLVVEPAAFGACPNNERHQVLRHSPVF